MLGSIPKGAKHFNRLLNFSLRVDKIYADE